MFVLVALVTVAQAWWCNGHMTVAMVAQQDLLKRNPNVFKICNSILAPLNGKLTHNKANTFAETACWADDIKTFSMYEFDNAHFIDRVLNPQGMVNATGGLANIIWAIENIEGTLKGQTATTAPLETSMALRFLIHFLGDLHQPLHCTTMWSKTFPNGDAGGNLFPIVFNENITELHALWDSCMGVLQNDLNRPLDNNGWESLGSYANWAMTNYTREDLALELAVTDLNKISIESYLKAVAYAYPDIEMGGSPSQEYLTSRWQVILRQIALGGYRLADILIRILGTKAESLENPQIS